MAVAATDLVTNRSDTDSTTTYTTASITYGANELVIAWIGVRATSAITIANVTVSGASGTWTEIDNQAISITGIGYLKAFRCLNGTGGTGALTIDVSGAGVTITGCHWSITKYTGADRSGTNGAGAIVQTTKGSIASNTALTLPSLSAFSDTRNATAGGIFFGATNDVTPGSGFTEIAQTTGAAAPTSTLQSQFRADNDTSVDWSWTTSANAAGIGIEIRTGQVDVTPSVLTSAVVFPSPTAQGAANTTPSVLTSAVVFPAPTVRGEGKPAPAVLTSAVVFPAPTVRGTANVTPSVLTSTVVFPAPTARGAANTTPSVLTSAIVFPSPTVTGTANVTPAVLAAPIVFPAPAPTGTANVTPSVLAAPITFPAPTATGTANTTPAVLAAPITFPAPTTKGDANVTPATLATAILFPDPTAIGTVAGDGTATPDPIVTVTFPAPTVTGDANVTPDVLLLPISFPAVTATGETGTADGTAFPATLGMAISFPSPQVIGEPVITPEVPTRGAAKLEPTYAVNAVARPRLLSLSMRFPEVTLETTHDWSLEDEEILLLL